MLEAREKLDLATTALNEGRNADSAYYTYSFFINNAKALLLDKKVKCNTQTGIIDDFDKHLVETGEFEFAPSFREFVLRINDNEPSKEFAESYLSDANKFAEQTKAFADARLESAV